MKFFSSAYCLYLISVTVVQAIPPPITEVLESSAKALAKGVDSISMTSSNNLESSVDDVIGVSLKNKQKIDTASFAALKDTRSPENIEIDNAFLNIVKLLETSDKAPAKGVDSLSTTSSSTFKSILEDVNEGPLKKKRKLETVLQARNTDIEVPSAPVKAPRVVGLISSSEHLPVRNLDSTKSESLQIKIDELLNDLDHLDLKIANPL